MLDFWAPKCGRCRAFDPHYAGLDKLYRDDAIFLKIDAEMAPEIAEQYSVLSLPEYVLVKQKEVVGHLKANQALKLQEFIKHMISF